MLGTAHTFEPQEPREAVGHVIPNPLVLLALVLMTALSALLLVYPSETSSGKTNVNQAAYAEISTTSTPLLLQAASSPASVSVPILVYHIVRPAYTDDSPAVRALAQTPEVFAAQMQYLRDAGYHPISFADLENYFLDGATLPAKPIILSFDDGWEDQIIYAFPILETYQYPATFFVFTNAIGTHGFISWNDLQKLRDAGMTIGSHSRSHPHLTQITDPGALIDEISGSKQILEERLGITVNEFAYPFGQYNAAIIGLVQQAGYRSARGDFYSGQQSPTIRYALSAMNAPTTLSGFMHQFP